MTVIHLKNTTSKRTPTKMRGTYKQASKKGEILFAVAVAITLISLTALAAFNGGVSMQAGGLEMTLDASLAKGMQLSFASL